MALQQAQNTSENEVTMVFLTFSCTFTEGRMISRRTSALSEWPRAETGPYKPDELVIGVMISMKTAQEETGNRCPEELITPHTS